MVEEDQDVEEEADEKQGSGKGEEEKGVLGTHAIKGIALAASRPECRERHAH